VGPGKKDYGNGLVWLPESWKGPVSFEIEKRFIWPIRMADLALFE